MTTTHELLILPERELRDGELTPAYPGRRAVLLVSSTETASDGRVWLRQSVFFDGRCVQRNATRVDRDSVHLMENLDFIIRCEELRSRWLGTLVLRRAIRFADVNSPDKTVPVFSIQLSAVDEEKADNKARRDRLYSSAGFDLERQPPSRRPFQSLSAFLPVQGDPHKIEALTVSLEALYGPYLALEASRIQHKDREAASAQRSNRPSDVTLEDPSARHRIAYLGSAALIALLIVIVLAFRFGAPQ
jgi:hypothetical protein